MNDLDQAFDALTAALLTLPDGPDPKAAAVTTAAIGVLKLFAVDLRRLADAAERQPSLEDKIKAVRDELDARRRD